MFWAVSLLKYLLVNKAEEVVEEKVESEASDEVKEVETKLEDSEK